MCFASSVITSLFQVRLHYELLKGQCPGFIRDLFIIANHRSEIVLSLIHRELLASCNEATKLIYVRVNAQILESQSIGCATK